MATNGLRVVSSSMPFSEQSQGYQPSFTEMLKQQANEKQVAYQELQHQQRRLAFEMERIKTYIEHLNGLLEVEGLPPIKLREANLTSPIGQPGNRSKDMPLRRSEWEGYSLPEAVEAILAKTNAPHHADVLVERIYEISTLTERKRAKHSLVSTLRQGALQGKWQSLGGNKYLGVQRQESLKLT